MTSKEILVLSSYHKFSPTGSLIWETKNGRNITLDKMDTNHLINTMALVQRNEEAGKYSEAKHYNYFNALMTAFKDEMRKRL